MNPATPHVAWPAPGRPAHLPRGRASFDLVLVHEGLAGCDLRAWGRTLALGEVDGSLEAPLEVIDVVLEAPACTRARIAAYLALPSARGLRVSTLRVRAELPSAPRAPCTVALFDVLRGGVVVRPRAVAIHADTGGRMRLAFASDFHQAAHWQPILDAARAHGGEAGRRAIDPRGLLARFVDEANALHARGVLDLVVLGGDLVDHVQSDGADRSNVRILLDGLATLRVPSLAIPGNHDYRYAPWRPRTFGLDALGLTWAQTRDIFRAAGAWKGRRFRWGDLRALKTHDAGGEPALAEHLRHIAPSTDFALTLHDLRLVCVSTGRDALTGVREMEPARLGLLAHSVAQSWRHPVSEGLGLPQVRRVRAELRNAVGAAVFLHAPVVHADRSGGIDVALRADEVGPAAPPAKRLSLERRLQRQGLRCGALFRNPGPFLGALLECSRPVVTFSGHVHRAAAMALDRETRRLRTVSFEPVADPERYALLLTAPAAGQRCRGRYDAPGYLLAEFEHGRLRTLQRHHLAEA